MLGVVFCELDDRQPVQTAYYFLRGGKLKLRMHYAQIIVPVFRGQFTSPLIHKRRGYTQRERERVADSQTRIPEDIGCMSIPVLQTYREAAAHV